MRSEAATPEELESLFEDALILGDARAVARLFDTSAVLAAEPGALQARGARQIASLAAAMRERGWSYLADPRHVVQTRDVTLVVAERATNVMRRLPSGGWRYLISLIETDNQGATNDARGA
jgi:hypothetical protein